MKPWKIERRRTNGERRLPWLAAIILLFIVGIIIRLFFVQVLHHDVYAGAAASQQKFYAELAPTRGKILIQDKDGSLYPLAANQDYAVIYAVPDQLKQTDEIKDKLYEFFKREAVAKTVDEQLTKEAEERLNGELAAVKYLPLEEQPAKEAGMRAAHAAWLSDPAYLAAKAQRREALIQASKQAILDEYGKLMNKKGDPYEVLEKRVPQTTAKQFHLALLALSNRAGILTPNDLEIKNGQMLVGSTGRALPIDGLNYSLEAYRFYPESSVAAHLVGFTAFDQNLRNGQTGKHGNYGLEGFFDEELFGKAGSVKSAKGAGGLVIAQDREYVGQQDGCDLILTIDRSVEFHVDKVLRQGMEKYRAEGGSIVVLKPQTGEIVAMSVMPDFDPNNYNQVKETGVFNNTAIFGQYEPGSVFKAITMAAALDQGALTPQTTYNDAGQIMIEGWPKPIKNSDFDTAGGHGQTTMVAVLEKSLNTGAIFAMNSIGPEVFADYVKRFGFGERTGIELEGESAGDIANLKTKKIKPISAATASFGQGLSVTPLQMALAYGALANGGQLMKPYVVKTVDCGQGRLTTAEPQVIRQVISRETASLISGMLVNVVEKGHSKRAQVAGYYIAGKTGTAQIAEVGKKGYVQGKYNHTFVGFGPVDEPQFVVAVVLNTPRGYEYAEATAVPMAHDVIEFLVNYLQIPKSR